MIEVEVDIVETLRNWPCKGTEACAFTGCICSEGWAAAEEIDRLRKENEEHNKTFLRHMQTLARQQREILDLKERNKTLTGHLVWALSDCWPYIHAHCTINSIKQRWREASDYLGKGQPDGN